jgi:voltage-gated sodium channel
MTLENWVDGIVKPVQAVYPLSLFFFIPFIVFTSFAVLNLFIGIIVEAMQKAHEEEMAEEQKNKSNQLEEQIAELNKNIRKLNEKISRLEPPGR